MGFPMSDNSPSYFLTVTFYVLHMFRMTVFFVIAGFFAHLSLHRKGPANFLKDRFRRIALPMVIAYIVSLILIIPSFVWAAWKLWGPEFETYLNASQATANANGEPELMHFWFLYYLMLFYLLTVAGSRLLHRLDRNDVVMTFVTDFFYRLCRSQIYIPVLTLLSALVLLNRENLNFWAGIPTPSIAFWNEAPAFFIYGLAFCTGWICNRERGCFQTFQKYWVVYLVIAITMTVISYLQLNPVPFVAVETTLTVKLKFVLSYSLASWCWIFALIGAGMKYFDRESARIRYIADASYWIYIAHIPLLFFLQTALMDVNLHWIIKFPLILLIATPVLFWTYEHWVRYTFIGNTLNGPRQRKTESAQ